MECCLCLPVSLLHPYLLGVHVEACTEETHVGPASNVDHHWVDHPVERNPPKSLQLPLSQVDLNSDADQRTAQQLPMELDPESLIVSSNYSVSSSYSSSLLRKSSLILQLLSSVLLYVIICFV